MSMMTDPRAQHPRRCLTRLILSATFTFYATLSAGAAPLDIRFLPPDISRDPICEPRPTDDVVTARWMDWDGSRMPDLSTSQIRRDLRLLRGIDADRWFDTIIAATMLLRELDTGYSETDMLMDHVDLHIAAGRISDMQNTGLTERLLAIDVSTSLRAQLLLSEMLMSGTGVPRDRELAMSHLVSAGYGGNSEALIVLAEMTIDGVQVPGWDISPEVAVTLAFGSLVGGLDPAICDRMNRIANEFRTGTLVRQDMPLAEEWYRLSADLGDFNAAWSVAQMHMESNGIVKDNETLLAYLEQAAAGGLTFAQAELGSIYEMGALAEQDLDLARHLYTQAAETGYPFAQVRLAQLLGDLDDPTPDEHAAWLQSLRALTELDDPPDWAFIQLGDEMLRAEGRWAGEAVALALYERAHEIDPTQPLTISRLVNLRMNRLSDYQSYLDVIGPLERSVRINGSNGPIVQLRNAYMCQSPRAPEVQRARFWAAAEDMSANLTPVLSDTDLQAAMLDPDPDLLATVQSQSLSGRGTAFAIFALMQEGSSSIAGDRDLLARLARSADSSPMSEIGKLQIRLAGEDGPSAATLDLLRTAVEAGEPSARTQLLRALTADPHPTADQLSEIRLVAETLAADGNGAAMRTLVDLEGRDAAATNAIRLEYQNTIAARGDFDALVFAMEGMSAGPEADVYVQRARAAMDCDLLSSLEMARATHRLARQSDAETWLNIAAIVVDDVGWQLIALGDAVLQISGERDGVRRALALFERAVAAGDRVGILRLLALRDDDRFDLDLDDAGTADLYIELVALTEVSGIPDVLERLRLESSAVQAMVTDVVDPRMIYADAALAGSAVAQLELARIVRREGQGPDALVRYATLLTSAAEQGEADAMVLLSEAYSYGLGVSPSLEASRTWLLRAAEAGNAGAIATVRLLTLEETTK